MATHSTGVNQYANTPITDFYLDIANFPTAASLVGDGGSSKFYVVSPRHQFRPDLLSYDIYGNSKYWWIIALLNRNQLQDPIRDLKSGMTIRYIDISLMSGVV